ncbi:PHB depolymerase family esterase [Micromonospora sp. HM5-17]|jgi:polyhydroxybutyrate depolymerase|uniref:extracellular catalytic domain type 1 short-chain-length polyhydroxyalkanoate depolymerase n=1 Tax=Micromonospora sp. HM5-17 TaxID=2487710 RepID=UPI000F46E029|nr:PHB depolymerase family esterase [Micromonospora sp. HM5-17]ROT33690.1 polyhydroxybutyrate depolymerase [Micromonospora sp. HM5-17]
MARRLGHGILAAVAVTAMLGAAGCGSEGGTSAGGAPSPSRAERPEVAPAPGDHSLTIDSGGVERTWDLHAPPTYRPGTPVPLVVALHGTDQSVATLRETSGLDAVADREGFLVAYPKALGREFSRLADQGDDVTFVRALVDHLVTRWSVDPARVYATGFSSGARMTYALGVEAADVFAAIAPVSGAFAGGPAEADPTYKPSRPVAVITFVGSQDRGSARIYAGLARWQKNLGCQVGKPVWVDREKTVNRTVSRCADGSEVVDYTLNGMGHAWPTSTADWAVDASQAMWEFFTAHTRRP